MSDFSDVVKILDEQVQEGSALQVLTACLFTLSAITAMRTQSINAWIRYIIVTGLVWLSLDELLMAHECIRIGLYKLIVLPEGLRDILILGYCVSSVLLFKLSLSKLNMNTFRWGLVGCGVILGLLIIGHDVLEIGGQYANYFEEILELCFAAILCTFFYLQSSKTMIMKSLLVTLSLLIILGSIIVSSKPKICPRLYSIPTIHYWGPFPYSEANLQTQ